MQTVTRFALTTMALAALAWPASVSSQTGSTAKACVILPTKDLEAHFGRRAGPVRGSDTSTVSTCSADFPDRNHGVDATVRPPGPAAVTVEQRFAILRPILEKNKARTQTFGNVGCFTDQTVVPGATLQAATCFLEDAKGYVSLSARSDNSKHLGFEQVKTLLEKAAAQRK